MPQKPNTRLIALQALVQWQRTHTQVDAVVDHMLQQNQVSDPRDTGLVKSIVYGVLRNLSYLDFIISRFVRQKMAQIKSIPVNALRVGLFQILFLDRIPPSAAVNETVNALSAVRQPKWIRGFVNATLRNIIRAREQAPSWPADLDMPPATRLSYPEWLFDRWQARYGLEQTVALCREGNREPPLTLRISTDKIALNQYMALLEQHAVSARPGEFAPSALLLTEYKGAVSSLPGYAEGLFQIQDEAAQLVTLLMHPFAEGKRVLDACAGLGGKTSHLAQLLPARSSLTALEPDAGRFQSLQQNLARLDLSHKVTIISKKLEQFAFEEKQLFDAVLLDAPCSGLGTIRRQPDIRWNRKPSDLGRYRALQTSLLHHGARLLAPKGVLVYITCSTEPEENEQLIEEFVAGQPQMTVDPIRNLLPEKAGIFIDDREYFKSLPGQHNLDGFFAARLVKS